MKKVVGIYELELTGSLIMVKVKGELRGAKEVNPLNALEIYNNLVKSYEKKELGLTTK
tara:strand:- start:52 stop:225 length:174 start_codon:yes stop_codon:yes gene_type:complete